MGCDIHGVFQKRVGETWQDVPSGFQENRHYQLFAALAGVRNGAGFAGIAIGDAIEPIRGPRGLPSDFVLLGEDYESPRHPLTKEAWEAHPTAKYYNPGEDGYGELWMGDHSHSWLTGAEMLAWIERAPIVRKLGVISREEFEKWAKGTRPEAYSGWVSGRDIVVIEQAEAEAGKPGTHVRVSWHSKLRDELGYFFAEVARLAALHGEIRFVFGFDS